MKYFYSSATMGFYGEGYWWHKLVYGGFPKLPFVAKTVTYKPKEGKPYNFYRFPFSKTMWNKIGLHNMGFYAWCNEYKKLPQETKERLIPSLAGSDEEIQTMIDYMYNEGFILPMVELNFSCPNVTSHRNAFIPKSEFDLSLKLGWDYNPFMYSLIKYKWKKVKRITLNSVPAKLVTRFIKDGGVSGERAQKYNWHFIGKYIKRCKEEGISIAGCSITSMDDVIKLKEMGVEEIALGSIMFTDHRLVKKLLENE